MKAFSPEVIKKLGRYVYLYLDPDTGEVFYVGKGKGNRAFAHLEDRAESEKTKRIEEIRRRGREPKIEILIHGLPDEQSAYRVEASVIDLLGKGQVTNAVRGWLSGTYGRMPAEQVEALYAAKEAVITEPSLLIRINRLFRYGMTPVELYDATRGTWVIGEKRNQVELAMAVFEGVVQEVYRVEGWFPAGSTFSTRGQLNRPGRWEFVGRMAEEPFRKEYVYKSVKKYLREGSQNPVAYVNL